MSSSHWKFCGPMGQQNSGRINAIAIHPTDSATLYVGAAAGGVWKSTDGGMHWKPLSDGWPFQPVASIAIDPQAPETVYVGTGDFDGWTAQAFGVMKSTDGGASFTNTAANEAGQRSVSAIVVDPEDPAIVTMTTGRGPVNLGQRFGEVFRSTTHGVTWTPVVTEAAEWKQLAIGQPDPNGVRYYYACGWHADGTPVLYRSSDRGATWIKLTDTHSITAIAPSMASPKAVYGMGPDKTVRLSLAGGDLGTWIDITGNLDQVALDWGQYFTDSYLRCLAIDNADRVIVGNKHIYQWDGVAWSGVSTEEHEDQHDLRPDPSNQNRVFFANDGGAWTMTWDRNSGQWTPWNSLKSGLGVTQVYKAGFSRYRPKAVMNCGTQDNGLFWSAGSPTHWDELEGLGPSGDVFAALIHPKNDPVQFAAIGPPGLFHGLYRTNDRWGSPPQDITPATHNEIVIAMDAAGTTLYVADDYLYAWSEVTQGWTSQLGGQQLVGTANRSNQSAIAVAPTNGQCVYTGSLEGQLWRGVGPDWTWARVDAGAPALPRGPISAIAVDQYAADTVLVAIDQGPRRLWHCTDVTGGSQRVWTDVNGQTSALPDAKIWAICAAGDFWQVGTDVGVFESLDGGVSWTDLTIPAGLPRVPVRDLALLGGSLLAATFGRGVWSGDILPRAIAQINYATRLTLFVEMLAQRGHYLHPQPDDKRSLLTLEHAVGEAQRGLKGMLAALQVSARRSPG